MCNETKTGWPRPRHSRGKVAMGKKLAANLIFPLLIGVYICSLFLPAYSSPRMDEDRYGFHCFAGVPVILLAFSRNLNLSEVLFYTAGWLPNALFLAGGYLLCWRRLWCIR